MGSRDLQPLIEPGVSFESLRPGAASRNVDEATDHSLVLTVLRKRWWQLALCVMISAGGALLIAQQFGAQSAECRGNLMYTGLPLPPGDTSVYPQPSLATYREILLSTASMQEICTRHGLEMPPTILAELFKCTVKHNSSIMELSLIWPNVEEGLKIVNDTMAQLIEEAVAQRRSLLKEFGISVEELLGMAAREVDVATEELRRARRQLDERMRAGGLSGNQYTSKLAEVNTAKAKLEDSQADKLGVEQRIAKVDARAAELIKLLQRLHIESRTSFVAGRGDGLAKGSDAWDELREIHNQLMTMGTNDPPATVDYAKWKSELAEVGRGVLPSAEELETAEIRKLEEQVRLQLTSRENLELALIPIAIQIEKFQKLANTYQQQADQLANDIMGISAGEVEDIESKLAIADRQYTLYKQRRDNIRQLEACKVPEFRVSMAASMGTTVIDSNMKKLFAFSLIGLSGLLFVPIFGLEWLAQRKSPVVKFADRWGLPVIAERLLANYGHLREKPVDWRSDEAVRMATLRIQQCMSRSGSVVLFSSLGRMPSPIHLMSSIAECLARREERVLIVDAMDPSYGVTTLAGSPERKRLAPRLGPRDPSHPTHPERALQSLESDIGATGLSDFLSRECEGVADLIQPTSCPGVDLISSGGGEFPSEAMASSCMTELFEHCRNTYTIILVAGPPVLARADFQMLAARSDAILLAATPTAVHDPASRAAVQDLIDLRAPVIGILT